MKLPERLFKISQMITQGETMADIGTDHGFLPLYLVRSGICPHVIMTDISADSLAKAKNNTAQMLSNLPDDERDSLNGRMDFRCGDGLTTLAAGEAGTVVIAGVGGNLISEMFECDITHAKSFKKFILQPRRHPGRLRHYLFQNGFKITDEHFSEEGKFICEILEVRPGSWGNLPENIIDEPPSSIKWEVPPYIAYCKETLAKEYVRRKLMREETILRSKDNSIGADKDPTKCNIEYLKALLDVLEQREGKVC